MHKLNYQFRYVKTVGADMKIGEIGGKWKKEYIALLNTHRLYE